MQLFIIIFKEFVQGIRDKKNFVLIILMPTLLTLILSTLISDNKVSDKSLSNLNVRFIASREDVKFINIDKLEILLNNLEVNLEYNSDREFYNSKADIIVEESIDNNKVKVIYDEKIEVEGNIISSIITDSLISNVLVNNNINIDFINSKKIGIDIKDNSYLNYYGITMITLTMLFSAVTGAYSMIREKNEKTLYKIITLPTSIDKIILGKVLGASIISLVQILFVIIISKNFINVNFGNNILLIVIILYLESLLSTSFGVLMGVCINDNKSCWIILFSLIMTCGLLGGTFTPLYGMNKDIIKYLSILSPITYVNNCIFNIVYLDDTTVIWNLSIMFITITLCFIIAAIKILGGNDENTSSCI